MSLMNLPVELLENIGSYLTPLTSWRLFQATQLTWRRKEFTNILTKSCYENQRKPDASCQANIALIYLTCSPKLCKQVDPQIIKYLVSCDVAAFSEIYLPEWSLFLKTPGVARYAKEFHHDSTKVKKIPAIRAEIETQLLDTVFREPSQLSRFYKKYIVNADVTSRFHSKAIWTAPGCFTDPALVFGILRNKILSENKPENTLAVIDCFVVIFKDLKNSLDRYSRLRKAEKKTAAKAEIALKKKLFIQCLVGFNAILPNGPGDMRALALRDMIISRTNDHRLMNGMILLSREISKDIRVQ